MSLQATGVVHDHLVPGVAGIGSSSARPEVIDAGSQSQIVVPGHDFIVNADYQRVGHDLVLSENGREVVIRGYFDSEHPPTLVSGEGAVVAGDTAARLAGPMAPGQYAQATAPQAAPAVGRVETIEGQVTIQHPDGTRVAATKDTAIQQGDVVQTAAGAKLGIVFVDKTTMALGANARLVIDEMVFNPANSSGSSVFSLLQGVFVVVTGEIAKQNHDAVHINTPVGSIGIRGTEFAVQIADVGGQSTFTLISGAIQLNTAVGATLLNVPGLSAISTGITAAPSAAFTLPAQQINNLFGQAQAVSNQLAPLSSDPGRVQQFQQQQQQPCDIFWHCGSGCT